MFAPIYSTAAQVGIGPSELDACELHVVAWMLAGPDDDDRPETPSDVIAAHRDREAARTAGRLDDFYEFDTVAGLT